MKLALIDLGSNSARMFVLKYTKEKGFEYISRRRIMTRLSEGMSESGFLQKAAMKRTTEVLSDFAAEAKADGASVLAVATAAVRKAQNSAGFCREVEKRTGIAINVISGETEALFDFKGAMDGLPQVADCLITDTGGGSTELILVKERRQLAKVSISVGAVSLYENFGNDYRAAERMIEEKLKEAELSDNIGRIPVVGLGGSVCAAARTDMLLTDGKTNGEIHGYEIPANRLNTLLGSLEDKTPQEREKLGIEKGRADTICYGLLPTAVIMRQIASPRLIVCRYGLREGILAEMSRGDTEEYIRNPQSFIEKYVKI